MSFFENITQKATQTGIKALEMTKGFSDTAMLKSTVNSEEKKIRDYYTKIGELYYNTHIDNYEEVFGEMIKEIQMSQKTIAKCREEIKKLKDIHYCEHCGAEVPNNSLYCSVCHTPVPGVNNNLIPSQENTSVNCPNCGSQVAQGMKFCTSCGKIMETLQSEIQICPNCSSNIDGALTFCTKCGAKLK